MATHAFRPGFRFSPLDGLVLVVGLVGAIAAWRYSVDLSVLGAAAVLHFFLFCNVFRVARRPELVWSGVFVCCAYMRVVMGMSWIVVGGIVSAATLAVVWREIRKESYHGVLWRFVNPGLRTWWTRPGHHE